MRPVGLSFGYSTSIHLLNPTPHANTHTDTHKHFALLILLCVCQGLGGLDAHPRTLQNGLTHLLSLTDDHSSRVYTFMLADVFLENTGKYVI